MKEIIGVVVIYNIRIEESETVVSLGKSLEDIKKTMDLVVWDNSGQPAYENGSVFDWGSFKIHYFQDGSNPGVSKAYNFAAQYAMQLKKKWILLLDQDTSFPIDAISKYVSSIESYPVISLFAPVLKLQDGRIFSPSRYRFKRGFGLKEISTGITSLKGISPLNSGMMIELEAFFSAGGYNEKVRLDFSDFQFMERFRKKYNEFCIVDVVAIHSFSDEETDAEKLNDRFAIYCEGAKNCEKDSFRDRLMYWGVVFCRAGSLVLRTGKWGFLRTFWKEYIK